MALFEPMIVSHVVILHHAKAAAPYWGKQLKLLSGNFRGLLHVNSHPHWKIASLYV
jgi:hypothetical protein